jgi:hypothetical protein
MKTMLAREAQNAFGRMIDSARAGPLLIEKQGPGIAIALEECELLTLRLDAQ